MTDSHVPAATAPVQLRPVDRYTLSDAILAAWHKHGNDSWCSIADEVIAALAAPPTLTPEQQHALAALDNLLQHCTDNTGEALIREAIMGGEA